MKETIQGWLDDNASRLAAALAYYSLLSLAPLFVISVSVVSFFLEPDVARGRIHDELAAIVGSSAAEVIQALVVSAESPERGLLSTLLGAGTLMFGASGAFAELQSALNAIWQIAPKPGTGFVNEIRTRVFSFALVLVVAFLLLVSLIFGALLSALGKTLAGLTPGGEMLWQTVNFAASFVATSALFALIFKWIPSASVRWVDVTVGACVTALLFTVGKFLLGLYLGKVAVGSPYGAAGSIVAWVVWVYYAAQVVFLGAEFTQVYARRRGHPIAPARGAVLAQTLPVNGERQAQTSPHSVA